MAIRKIREVGDEVLEKQCKKVDKMTIRTKILIQDMLDTMYDAMGVGLAAPQVGILKQIVTIDVGEGPIVLINPEIIESDGTQTGEEGCLSLPGIHETVKRGDKIRVKYMDENFVEHEEEVEGYLARVMQHEFDHLDGKMFIDHISPLRKQMIKGKLNTMLKGKARSSYKMKQVK